MPCYTISQAKLDLTKANLDALKAALSQAGFVVVNETSGVSPELSLRHRDGTAGKWNRTDGLVLSGNSYNLQRHTTTIQTAYTSSVIQVTAKRLGWQVQTKSENQFLVSKR